MTYVFTIFAFLYLVLTITLLIGWKNIPLRSVSKDQTTQPEISIVIPVRNEAHNIGRLLNDLNVQKYPFDKFEVIIVDDQSDDETVEIVNGLMPELNFKIQLISLKNPSNISHKKAAITEAVFCAGGQWVITTDGDCRVQPTWLSSYADLMNVHNSQMIAGPVLFFEGKGIFDRLQRIEFASLIGAGAASISLGMPTMCNGANLAFRKSAFDEVDGYSGYEHIMSGDDEFLMHKIHTAHPEGVLFLKDRGNTVSTSSKESLGEFANQRRRWAGKWRTNTGLGKQLLAVFVFLYYLFWLVLFVFAMVGGIPIEVAAPLLLSKWLGDFLYIHSIMRFFQKRLNLFDFALLELIYPIYVVFFGVMANFGGYNWKGRRHTQ